VFTARVSALPWIHHAEPVRIHSPPWRGLFLVGHLAAEFGVPPIRAYEPIHSASESSKTMYEMYPEWGPAKNSPDNPYSQDAVQAALDLRDNGSQRPDDN